MASEADSATLQVVVERLGDLRTEVGAIRDQLTSQAAVFVIRGEWVQRNEHVDATFRAQGREIGDLRADTRTEVAALRAEVEHRRVPWTAVVGGVASIITSVVALGVALNGGA